MKRHHLAPPAWHNLKPFRVKLTRVRCHAEGLSAWEIHEWEVWQDKEFIQRGSYPCNDRFITVDDVLEQLRYEFIDQHQMETAAETYDPTYGL